MHRDPLYFASGASAPADLEGFARILHPFGISVPELSAPALRRLLSFAHLPLPVLADTSAFSEVNFETGAPVVVAPIDEVTWERILTVQIQIAEAFGARAWVVAPDRVGCQRETLARLRRFAPSVRALRSLGAHVIVAIQRGEATRARFDAEVADVLGFDDFVRGIPANKDAVREGELEEYLRIIRPRAVHLLGVGPRNPRFRCFADLLTRLVPEADVSCDSNAITAACGRTNGSGGGARRMTWWGDELAQLAARGVVPAEEVRAGAIVMSFGPHWFFAQALAAYQKAGLGAPTKPCRRPLQLGLFDQVIP